jgi:uncharacterized membrane protein YvbJ
MRLTDIIYTRRSFMYCKKCGKQIDDDSMFCSFCGTKVGKETNIEKKAIPEKMIKFSDTLIEDYKLVLPIKTMYVGISESLEKYNLIYKIKFDL